MKRLTIVLLGIATMLSGIVATSLAEEATTITEPPVARAAIACTPQLTETITAGSVVSIEVDKYENTTDHPVRIQLESNFVDRQWNLEPGDILNRQVFRRTTPPTGRVFARVLQYDREGDKWVVNDNRLCSPPTSRIVPYFAKCRAVSTNWDTDRTNRTKIKRMGLCLGKYFPRLTSAEINHVATCESHWSQNSSTGKYKGVFQLGDAEFRAFSHQGPSWMHDEFVRNAWFSPEYIFHARANILAALAHANRYGWGAWSCAP